MATADEVIVEFEARVGKYEADLKRSAATFERVTQAQQRQMQALERQISASSGVIGNAFKGLAALFGAQQVIKLSDDYTRLQNSLKVAGLEGEGLLKVQSQLLALGGEYGVSINTLADLYGNLSQTGKDLGASQSQILTINRAVAQSLIVTGKSSAEASGAVLGLVQAFGNGKLQAEEFAQINEGGLRPLLQAAAATEKYGGSIQKFRAAVYAGKVTSQEFFQAILDGAGTLEGKAANATLTLEGAFTALNNRLIEFVGSAASSSGAAGALATGIQALGNNLDTVSKALAVIVAIVGVRWVAATVSAAAASVGLAAANSRAALTAEALSGATYQANAALLGEAAAARLATASVSGLAVAQGAAATAGQTLLAALGGPVGAAVLALGGAIAVLASREAEMQAAADALSGSIDAQTAKFEALRQKKAQAAAETNTLSKAQRDALTATASLTGEANLLANAWGRVAAQAKSAAIEQAKASYSDAQRNRRQAQNALDSRAETNRNRPSNQSGGSPVGAIGRGVRAATNALGITSPTRAAQQEQKERGQLNAAIKNEADAREEYAKVVNSSLTTFKQDAAPAAAAPGKKTKAAGAGPKGFTPNENTADRDMARLLVDELQARLDLAKTVEERADLQSQILAEERKEREAQIAGNKNLSDAQKKLARESLDRQYGPAPPDSGDITVGRGYLQQKIDRDKAAEQARQAQDIADEQYRAQQNALSSQLELADSSAERKRLALASIDLEERYQRAQYQAIIDLEGANSEAGKRAQMGLNSVSEISGSRRQAAERSNQSPLEAYRTKVNRSDGAVNDEIESYVVDELNSVRDSISSAVQKRLGIKDPLLAGLLNLFIEDQIMKPLANALKGADGSGGGSFLSSIGSALGSLFGGGRAIGGPVQAGKVYKVGENGQELFRPQQNGVIVPNHALRGGSNGPQTVIVKVEANDYFDARVAGISQEVAMPIAQQVSSRMGAAVTQGVLKAVPGRLANFQRDGT